LIEAAGHRARTFLQIDRKILKLPIKSIGHSDIQNYGKKRGEIHIELAKLLVSVTPREIQQKPLI
jgi:hypothetical protein